MVAPAVVFPPVPGAALAGDAALSATRAAARTAAEGLPLLGEAPTAGEAEPAAAGAAGFARSAARAAAMRAAVGLVVEEGLGEAEDEEPLAEGDVFGAAPGAEGAVRVPAWESHVAQATDSNDLQHCNGPVALCVSGLNNTSMFPKALSL